MAISTNRKPTIYRNLYENTAPGDYLQISFLHEGSTVSSGLSYN